MTGKKICDLRHRQGLTQEQLGSPRYSRSYVSQVEHGTLHPSREAIAHFAARLGVSPTDLLQGADDDERRLRHLQQRARSRRRASDWREWHHALRDALVLARAMGDRDQESWCLAQWAEGWWERRHPARALLAYHRAVDALQPSAASTAGLWLRIAEVSLHMGEPERAWRAYLHGTSAASPPETRWRSDIGQAWALVLMGCGSRAHRMFHGVADEALGRGYAVWASLALSGQGFGIAVRAPGDALARFLQAGALVQGTGDVAAAAAAQLGAGLVAVSGGDPTGLTAMRRSRLSFQGDGQVMAFARAARLEMFALLTLDRVESARALGREILTHLRDRDGSVLTAWIRDPLALAGAWDGSSDSTIQETLAECSGVYRALHLGPDARRVAAARDMLTAGGSPALRQWVQRTPAAAWC